MGLADSNLPRLVVRPFKTRGGDDELTAFAEGLTDDITGGLALFSHLSVSAGRSEPSRDERFALEGTLRKSGKRFTPISRSSTAQPAPTYGRSNSIAILGPETYSRHRTN